ncbi:MAG: type II toxin-antitoxin system PemK/MazF family toxin [Gemmatimonas sp.]
MVTRRESPPRRRARPWVPLRGDVIGMGGSTPMRGDGADDLSAGRRMAVVISPGSYNARTGLAIVCVITSQVTGYPFEVVVPKDLVVQGVVLSDQIRTIDWRAGRAKRVCSVSAEVVDDVRQRLGTLV